MTSIAICIASFNRRARTLACLDRLYRATLPAGVELYVHLLDDGSSDGTAGAVRSQFPQVRIHFGDGACFWAGGMRIAYGAALAETHEYYVWLNDDVELSSDALERALNTASNLRRQYGGEHVVVGAMRGRDGSTTYSGFERSSAILPWKLRRIEPHPNEPRECFTVNGNFVLIPGSLAQKIGNIDRRFIHMHADIVLGLLARQLGARNWILAGHAGICEANIGGRKDWLAPGLSVMERLVRMEHPLGYPLKPNIAYSRYFGIWAPIMVAAPYLTLVRAMLASGPGKAGRPSRRG